MAKGKKQTSDDARPVADEGKKPKIVRANVHRTNVRSEKFLTIYANDAQVQTTPWDFRITLGQIVGVPTGPDAALAVNEVAEIYLSPQFAKRVAMVLIGQLQHYEETVGPISGPED